MTHSIQEVGDRQWLYRGFVIRLTDDLDPVITEDGPCIYEVHAGVDRIIAITPCMPTALGAVDTWIARGVDHINPPADDILALMPAGAPAPQLEEGKTPEQLEAFLLRHPSSIKRDEAVEGPVMWNGELRDMVIGDEVHRRSRRLQALLTEMGVLATPHPEVA